MITLTLGGEVTRHASPTAARASIAALLPSQKGYTP